MEGWWYIRYFGKEGWVLVFYLKKVKDDLLIWKKNLVGLVEIIGNIMEISNFFNKKVFGDKEVLVEGEGFEVFIIKKEISLLIFCNVFNGSVLVIFERIIFKLV